MAKETTTKFELPNEVVYVKPNYNNPGWIKNPRHAGFFKLEGTYDNYTCAMSRNGSLKNPFTNEEKEYLESLKELDLEPNDLSIYKKGSMIRTMNIKLGKDPLQLDLSNVHDYMKYKVLLTNTDKVAPSIKDVKKKQTYKYYIERQADLTEVNKAKTDVNKTVYSYFGKIESNRNKLISVLNSYSQLVNKPIKKTSKETTLDWLQNEVMSIIDNDKNRFYEMIQNPHFETIQLIGAAVACGAIVKSGTNYFLEGGTDKIGNNLKEVIQYLDTTGNQETRLVIEEKVKINS